MRHYLEQLAEELTRNGMEAELVGQVSRPYLTVANTDTPGHNERVLCQQDGDGHWSFKYPLVSTMTPLGALPTAPGCARAHLRDTLEQWNLSVYEEVAELLISEMVTNAVEASTDDVGCPVYVNGRMAVVVVRLVATGRGLVLEVWDLVPTLPVMQNAAPLEEHGRGMFLVETLSYQWDWKTANDWPGKCVWAELRSSLPPA